MQEKVLLTNYFSLDKMSQGIILRLMIYNNITCYLNVKFELP